MADELKPCPNPFGIYSHDVTTYHTGYDWNTKCHCGVQSGGRATKEQSIAAWNTRPNDAVIESLTQERDALLGKPEAVHVGARAAIEAIRQFNAKWRANEDILELAAQIAHDYRERGSVRAQLLDLLVALMTSRRIIESLAQDGRLPVAASEPKTVSPLNEN